MSWVDITKEIANAEKKFDHEVIIHLILFRSEISQLINKAKEKHFKVVASAEIITERSLVDDLNHSKEYARKEPKHRTY